MDEKEVSGGSDYKQDLQLFKQEFGQMVEPIVMILFEKLKGCEDRINDLEELLMKMITGMDDSVKSYKRSGLIGSLGEKYGKDIEPYGEMYQDFAGSNPLEDLADQIMTSGIGEDQHEPFAQEFLNQLKGKFGKYTKAPQVEAEITKAEVPAEGGTAAEEGEKAAEEVAGEEEAAPEKPSDAMFKKLMNARGGR